MTTCTAIIPVSPCVFVPAPEPPETAPEVPTIDRYVGRVWCMDALELMRALPTGSVDAIISSEYPTFMVQYTCSTGRKWDMNEQEIVRLYTEERLTLRQIADQFQTNHHMIRRILARNGIAVTTEDRKRKPFTEEHRRKIGATSKGRRSWNRGMKVDEAGRRVNMKARLGTSIDLDVYEDYERLLFLSRILSKRKAHIGLDDPSRKAFLDKFYFDPQFNTIYNAWIASCKNRWYRPTLDHMTSQANGGGWELSNLQFLTWFENRAKADMNEDEWQQFRHATHTTSDLFIRVST